MVGAGLLLPPHYNPSVIFLRKCHLPLHKGGACLVLTLLFGVIFMIVGTGVPDGPKRADMESAPTDLNVVLKFVCRGGYYPPVYDNPSVIFSRKCHLPLHKGGVFVVLAL